MVRGLSCPETRGILVPRQDIKPVSPALEPLDCQGGPCLCNKVRCTCSITAGSCSLLYIIFSPHNNHPCTAGRELFIPHWLLFLANGMIPCAHPGVAAAAARCLARGRGQGRLPWDTTMSPAARLTPTSCVSCSLPGSQSFLSDYGSDSTRRPRASSSKKIIIPASTQVSGGPCCSLHPASERESVLI